MGLLIKHTRRRGPWHVPQESALLLTAKHHRAPPGRAGNSWVWASHFPRCLRVRSGSAPSLRTQGRAKGPPTEKTWPSWSLRRRPQRERKPGQWSPAASPGGAQLPLTAHRYHQKQPWKERAGKHMSTTEHKPAKHAQEAQGHSVTTRLKEDMRKWKRCHSLPRCYIFVPSNTSTKETLFEPKYNIENKDDFKNKIIYVYNWQIHS